MTKFKNIVYEQCLICNNCRIKLKSRKTKELKNKTQLLLRRLHSNAVEKAKNVYCKKGIWKRPISYIYLNKNAIDDTCPEFKWDEEQNCSLTYDEFRNLLEISLGVVK